MQLSIVIPTLGRPALLRRVLDRLDRSFPFIGPRAWGSADTVYRQALAEPFLEAWRSKADTWAAR